jgi:hypothetical protein
MSGFRQAPCALGPEELPISAARMCAAQPDLRFSEPGAAQSESKPSQPTLPEWPGDRPQLLRVSVVSQVSFSLVRLSPFLHCLGNLCPGCGFTPF